MSRDYYAKQDTANQALKVKENDSYYDFLKEMPLDDKTILADEKADIFTNRFDFIGISIKSILLIFPNDTLFFVAFSPVFLYRFPGTFFALFFFPALAALQSAAAPPDTILPVSPDIIFLSVMTQFIQNLRLTEDQFALMDMEAGIEHFGRGIDNGVDLILIIIDPSYESLQLSKKIGELSESIRKTFYYVLNKVTKENQEMMYEAVWNSSRVAVSLSADPGIMGEGLMGKELSEKPDAIENLTEFLLSI
jgi:hypothetical protein